MRDTRALPGRNTRIGWKPRCERIFLILPRRLAILVMAIKLFRLSPRTQWLLTPAIVASIPIYGEQKGDNPTIFARYETKAGDLEGNMSFITEMTAMMTDGSQRRLSDLSEDREDENGVPYSDWGNVEDILCFGYHGDGLFVDLGECSMVDWYKTNRTYSRPIVELTPDWTPIPYAEAKKAWG